eukprot:scaffold5988_cov381-Prasinococcus_capsulatus_cf.AAC.13
MGSSGPFDDQCSTLSRPPRPLFLVAIRSRGVRRPGRCFPVMDNPLAQATDSSPLKPRASAPAAETPRDYMEAFV